MNSRKINSWLLGKSLPPLSLSSFYILYSHLNSFVIEKKKILKQQTKNKCPLHIPQFLIALARTVECAFTIHLFVPLLFSFLLIKLGQTCRKEDLLNQASSTFYCHLFMLVPSILVRKQSFHLGK